MKPPALSTLEMEERKNEEAENIFASSWSSAVLVFALIFFLELYLRIKLAFWIQFALFLITYIPVILCFIVLIRGAAPSIPIALFVLLAIFGFVVFAQEPLRLYQLADSPSDFLPSCNCSAPTAQKAMLDAYFARYDAPMLDSDKLLVYRTTNNGAGNRFHGLVAAFALALATNRTFLIDWTITDRFNAPLSTLFTAQYPMELNSTYHTDRVLQLQYCSPCFIRRPVQAFNQLVSSNFTGRVMTVNSTQYFLPALYTREDLKHQLCKYTSPEAAHAALFPALFKPSPEVERSVQSKLSAFDGHYVVGIQLRATEINSLPPDLYYNVFNSAILLTKEHPSARFFIASDSAEVKAYAAACLGDRLIVFSSESMSMDLKGTQAAIVDVLLLSHCDNVILTPYSTFGQFAIGISQVRPHYVERGRGKFLQDITSSPKFHYYFGLTQFSRHSYQSSDGINQYDIRM